MVPLPFLRYSHNVELLEYVQVLYAPKCAPSGPKASEMRARCADGNAKKALNFAVGMYCRYVADFTIKLSSCKTETYRLCRSMGHNYLCSLADIIVRKRTENGNSGMIDLHSASQRARVTRRRGKCRLHS